MKLIAKLWLGSLGLGKHDSWASSGESDSVPTDSQGMTGRRTAQILTRQLLIVDMGSSVAAACAGDEIRKAASPGI